MVKYLCSKCRSAHIVKTGFQITRKKGRRQRMKCQQCGHTFYQDDEREVQK